MNEQADAVSNIAITNELLDEWASSSGGPVALHCSQKLLPIETLDSYGIVFPPTYADIGYNIDTLSDGTKVATIDSVGSQANRMEPLFKKGGPLEDLVPQVEIQINSNTVVSIFDLPHRAADATVQSSPGLAELASNAFNELKKGNASDLCALAPTSLVFGVWDSRGGTGEKRPRLVRSVIRARNIEVLHTAAQFNSIWKKLDDTQQKELRSEADRKSIDLSAKGFADAPATFRKTTKIQQYRDGAPNPDARVLGGVLVRGEIEREVTINLLALRGLRGGTEDEGLQLRRYLLALTLLSAIQEMELFLREGCLLRYSSGTEEIWRVLPRRGNPQPIDFSKAQQTIKDYIREPLAHFKEKWPKKFKYEFTLARAKEILAKKAEQEEAAGL